MGVKILAQYAVICPYDFVNILGAVINEVILKGTIRPDSSLWSTKDAAKSWNFRVPISGS